MFGLLPDLTPRDSHSIWYTSSRNPISQAALLEAHDQRHHENNQHGSGQHTPSSRRAGQLLVERSALARLRVDEQQMDRRRLNVQNFGSTWLKPPGVPKTLHQIREERREQEEHAEAMRREQLAQELADAEAAGQDVDVLEDDPAAGGDEEEARDLDDEIPDAEESFGFDGGEDSDLDNDISSSEGAAVDDDDDDDDEDEDDVDDDATEGGGIGAVDEGERRDGLVAARMRMADDAFRQAMARGDVDGEDMYGAEEELEASGQGHMLDEEDLLAPGEGAADDLGIDMDADLDDDIPEAGELSGVYEHTDSEAELSLTSSSDAGGQSSEDEDEDEGDISFAPRAAPLRPPLSPTGDRGRGGMGMGMGLGRGHAGPRSSMDLSGLLSADGSSMMDSSPNVRAQRR